MRIFSVYDSKAEAYLQPFFALTTAAGVRMFQRAAMDASSDFHLFAADYTLFELGEFDQSSGLIEQHATLVNLGTALQHVAQANGSAAIASVPAEVNADA